MSALARRLESVMLRVVGYTGRCRGGGQEHMGSEIGARRELCVQMSKGHRMGMCGSRKGHPKEVGAKVRLRRAWGVLDNVGCALS